MSAARGDADVIVVGSGAGGGVAAARLSEDPDRRVLLLEAGPDFPWERTFPPLFAVSGERSWFPSGLPEFDWWLWNEPMANGHRVRLPRGRLVGGSTMVNSTIAVWPADSDLDGWVRAGATGWDPASLAPFRRRVETDLDRPDDPSHGHDGPIRIRRYRRTEWAPVNEAFVQAAVALGFREHDDLNAPDAAAGVVGAWPHNRYKEERGGTLVTYLRGARPRPNLTIQGDTLVDRVLFDGDRATGVRARVAGEWRELHADQVILAAGVYGTPAILQRSGIGEPEDLAAAGVPARTRLPVGRNLRDHPAVGHAFTSAPLSSVHGRLIATVLRSAPDARGEPGVQVHPMPLDEEEGRCTLFIFLTRSDASGTVTIRSADPDAPPRIDHRYLTGTDDLRRFRDAWALCHDLLATAPFRAAGARSTAPAVEEALAIGLVTAHHQSSSCRMGPADGSAVVDPRLAVHGTRGLMVADASVFPDTIMHNPNLTTMLVGEVAAAIVRGER
ncbi:MAG: GMC family oxidoreductase N-terminal domain-containing protein [Chloroflexota bacterium]